VERPDLRTLSDAAGLRRSSALGSARSTLRDLVARGRGLARTLGDLFFPPVCVHCGGLVEEGDYRHLCADCGGRIEFVHPPACEICGHPLAEAAPDGPPCPHCADLVPAFGRGRTGVLLRGPARSMLIELKYRGGRHVLADLEAIFRRCPGLIAHVHAAVLVPVPLHPRKRRERGFNQSELLARALARAAGLAPPQALLCRRVDTPSQTALDRSHRRANLKSTLNSCAEALRRAGCLSLDVATFAHG
jgi:predicted amidophosphoribosyltransferase